MLAYDLAMHLIDILLSNRKRLDIQNTFLDRNFLSYNIHRGHRYSLKDKWSEVSGFIFTIYF